MTGKEFEQIIRISFERKKVYELDNRQEAVPELCARLLQDCVKGCSQKGLLKNGIKLR